MSRVGKNPIKLPAGVEVKVTNNVVNIKGGKGHLDYNLPELVAVKTEDGHIVVDFDHHNTEAKTLAGTTRARLNNMVQGVSKGFERKLTLLGVGYRAAAAGKKLNLTLGFSHPVEYAIPDGITIETPSQTEILVKGIDKQLVGQVAANIREFRPPEPYKGKGVRYADEKITIKEAKKK